MFRKYLVANSSGTSIACKTEALLSNYDLTSVVCKYLVANNSGTSIACKTEALLSNYDLTSVVCKNSMTRPNTAGFLHVYQFPTVVTLDQ